MDRLFNFEQLRMIVVSSFSPVIAYLTPTKGFILSLVIAFAFNIWAGMRADGVAICRCRNFRFRKFKNALAELLLYLLIVEVIFSVMVACGDKDASLIVIKSLTYVIIYVYAQNSFRNLIVAYPKNKALRMIYHLIRFEFKRATPSHITSIINRIEGEIDEHEKINKHEENTDN